MSTPSSGNGPPSGGHKYILIKQILRAEPSQWIAEQRKPDPDTGRVASYAEVAEAMNAILARRWTGTPPIRITHESVRRWDPNGSYQWTGDQPGDAA